MTHGEMLYLAVVVFTFAGFAAAIGSLSLQQTRRHIRAARLGATSGQAPSAHALHA